jgi:DME family drug/metabolite transporter
MAAGDDRQAAIGRRCVLGAAVLWSLGGVVTKRLELDAPAIAFYRSLFAGLALLPLIRPSHWRFRPAMILCGLVFGAMVGGYIGATKATTAANAIFLQCSATFWTIPLGLLFLGERPDPRSVLGIALASPGIVAIVLFGHGGTSEEWRGVALGLGSGLGYAGVMIGMRGMRDLDPIWLSAINNLGGALALGAWSVAVVGPIARPGPSAALALMAFGVVQMAIPYALFARGLRSIKAPEAGLIGLLEPILNPIWVVLASPDHERPRLATIIGGLFLLAGVACRYLPRRRGELPVGCQLSGVSSQPDTGETPSPDRA